MVFGQNLKILTLAKNDLIGKGISREVEWRKFQPSIEELWAPMLASHSNIRACKGHQCSGLKSLNTQNYEEAMELKFAPFCSSFQCFYVMVRTTVCEVGLELIFERLPPHRLPTCHAARHQRVSTKAECFRRLKDTDVPFPVAVGSPPWI